MRSKSPHIWLEDIIDACNSISDYVENVSEKDFVNDDMRYNASIRMISVIGESIANLEDKFKDSYPQIPWQEVKAMRNRLIHEYWQTDLEQVYLSCTQEVPDLRKMVKDILNEIADSD